MDYLLPHSRQRQISPWGEVQNQVHITDGIDFCLTASHGGFHLSQERQKAMPEALRITDGWYEEDVDYCLIVCAFPEYFEEKEYNSAITIMREYLPDTYEAWTGEKIGPSQSRVRAREFFEKEHKNDWVVISAVKMNINSTVINCFATKGGDRNIDKGKYFLVSEEEYTTRNEYGFVINPLRHLEITGNELYKLEQKYAHDLELPRPDAWMPVDASYSRIDGSIDNTFVEVNCIHATMLPNDRWDKSVPLKKTEPKEPKQILIPTDIWQARNLKCLLILSPHEIGFKYYPNGEPLYEEVQDEDGFSPGM